MKIVWHISRVPLLILLGAFAMFAIGVHSLGWYAERNPDSVQRWVSDELGEPVRFATITADWDGIDLRLELDDIRIGDQDDEAGVLRFDRLVLGIELLQGLLQFDWRPAYLHVSGARLALHRLEDRSIRIAGIQRLMSASSQTLPADTGGAEFWMLSQANVEIRDSEFLVRDDRRWADQEPLRLSKVNIRLRNEGRVHHLEGAAQLSPSYGNAIAFNARIKGNPLGNRWSGEVGVRADDLRVSGFLGQRELSGIRVREGALKLESSARWSNGHLKAADLQIALTDFDLVARSRPDHPLDWPRLAGRVHWTAEDSGWQMTLEELAVHGPFGAWPTQDLRVAVQESEAGERRLMLDLERLNLADVSQLTALSRHVPAELATALQGLAPTGWLRQIQVVVVKGGAEPAFSVRARAEDLSVQPWNGVPGIRGLSADLSAQPNVISMVLGSRNVEARFPGLFRDPLTLDKLDGIIAVVKDDDELRVSGVDVKLSNADIAVSGDFKLELPQAGSPRLDLEGYFVGNPEDRVKHYLPAGVIPEAAMEWLDRAFLAGKARNGALRFEGDLDAFPFEPDADGQPTGEFVVEFDVYDGGLDFSPLYPNIENASATVRFENAGLTIFNGKGSIMGAAVDGVTVTIPDLNDTTVHVVGHAKAALSNFDEFVESTPLKERLGPALRLLALRGEAELDIEVYMPFDGKGPDVRGEIQLPGVDLFVKPMNVRFADFAGTLKFDPDGVSAKGLTAKFRDRSIRIDVATTPKGDTAVEVTGRLPLQAMLGPDGDQLAGFASGEADWRLGVVAPSWRRSSSATLLRVSSDLKGIALDLPQPLTKAAADAMPFDMRTSHKGNALGPVKLQLGDQLKADFRFAPDGEIMGEVHYGRGEPPQPTQAGVAIRAQVAETSLGDWLELADSGGEGSVDSSWLRMVEAKIGLLHAYGRRVRDADVALSPRAPEDGQSGWKLDVSSGRVGGVILVPGEPTREEPVYAAFTHLHIAERKTEGQASTTDPRSLPPIRLIVDDFRYGGRRLGRLDLEAMPTPVGLNVHQVDLSSDVFSLQSWGTWQYDGKDHQSQFTIELNSDQFDKAMESFGLGRMLEAKGFSAVFDTRWAGSPTAFDMGALDGNLSMKFGEGRVLDVDPGAGRLFGLLSFTTLPRRLRGDFADISKDGFVFDSIEGTFILNSGVAETENLRLDGPAAKLDIRGVVDLRNQTLDQRVDVIPEVSSTIPLAGVLAGGVGVGAALLVLQQVLNEPLNRLAKLQYRMHGPWDDPVVERLSAGGAAGRSEQQSPSEALPSETFGVEGG